MSDLNTASSSQDPSPADPQVEHEKKEETDDAPLEEEKMYKLKASDGVILEMSELAMRHSETLLETARILANAPDGTAKDYVVVESVDGQSLKKIVEWCENYKHTLPTQEDEDEHAEIVIPEWDREHLNIDNKELFDLLCGADYLGVKGLVNVGCKTVANMATGKTSAQMRETFGITADEQDEQPTDNRVVAIWRGPGSSR
ncbi:unnamed protein product [Caenorhabditis sp. 36 PRJEB53466]|nr:unnamed protein product [Caenorhabditis sp. 36 PRJEB53466]